MDIRYFHVILSWFLALTVDAFFWYIWPDFVNSDVLFHTGRVLFIIVPCLIFSLWQWFLRNNPYRKSFAKWSFLYIIWSAFLMLGDEIKRLYGYYDPQFMPVLKLLKYVDKVFLLTAAIAIFWALGLIVSSVLSKPKTMRGNAPAKRANSAEFGDADWCSLEEVSRILPSNGSLPIGERYRVDLDPDAQMFFDPNDSSTWGKGGKNPLVTFNCDFGSTHGLVFAGSGGYKTTGYVVPMLVRWSGNAVVLDPSTEIYPMLSTHRERMNNGKRKVFAINPDKPGSGFNVLDWIDTDAPSCYEDISAVTAWISTGKVSRSDTNEFFRNNALQLIRGLLAHILCYNGYTKDRTLKSLREEISIEETKFLKRLADIYEQAERANLKFVQLVLGPFLSMTPQTFSGVYSTASELTHWLSYERFANLVSEGSFRTNDIVTKDMDIFICIDINTLQNHGGLARVIHGALINAMYYANGNYQNRVAFIMDEAARLGQMSIIEVARDAGRKYGITMILIYQSLGQVREQWGKDSLSSWMESTSWQSFAAINDLETAEWLSKRCGTYTMEVKSTSTGASQRASIVGSGASQNTSVSLQKRALITPDEIMSTMRRDDQLIFIAGMSPIRCGRAIYFRRPEMVEACDPNRFAQAQKNSFRTQDGQMETPSPAVTVTAVHDKNLPENNIF